MKYCPKCGKPLDNEELRYCPNCGNALQDANKGKEESIEQNIKQSKKKSGIKFALIGLVLVLVCAGGYFAYDKYQKNQQEKERIAQKQALAKQKEKEKQEKKEQEEKEKKEAEELAKKANINKTILYALDNHRYSQYMDIIGEPLAIVMTDYNNDMNNGTIDVKSYDFAGTTNDKINAVNWMSLKLSEPVYAEHIMSAMSYFPLAILDKEKGYFLENNVNLGNGHIVKIYYYIDQTTLNVINVEITEKDFKKVS